MRSGPIEQITQAILDRRLQPEGIVALDVSDMHQWPSNTSQIVLIAINHRLPTRIPIFDMYVSKEEIVDTSQISHLATICSLNTVGGTLATITRKSLKGLSHLIIEDSYSPNCCVSRKWKYEVYGIRVES